MCKKTNYKIPNPRIDKCMIDLIDRLSRWYNIKTKACCCGHGKYPMTIIVKYDLLHYELFSGEFIPRRRNFYKRDTQGYYYIPEVVNK